MNSISYIAGFLSALGAVQVGLAFVTNDPVAVPLMMVVIASAFLFILVTDAEQGEWRRVEVMAGRAP